MSKKTLTMNGRLRLLGAAIAVLQLTGVAAVAAGQLAELPALALSTPRTAAAEAGEEAGRIAASAAEPATEAVLPAASPTTTAVVAPDQPPATPAASPVAAAPPTAPTDPSPPAPPVAPRPAPATAPAPAPAPPPSRPAAPAPRAQQQDPAERVRSTFEAAVPGAWRGAIAVRFEIIEGDTSWASGDGVIKVARAHANGSDRLLRALLAHEFGHLVAFRYGSYEYNGAAPEGWPPYSSRPEEAWADCVSRAFTGIDDPSHGLPSCTGEPLAWTSRWLGAGPGAHERTG